MRTIRLLPIALVFLALSCGRGAHAPTAAGAPPRPNGYELQLGKEVFQRYCVGCHGDTGAGDGFTRPSRRASRTPTSPTPSAAAARVSASPA